MLSVIICTKDNQSELLSTLFSLENSAQGMEERIQVIVVDKSIDALPKRVKESHLNLKVVRQLNSGIYNAFNEGLKHVYSNYYVLFLNSGDFLSQDSLRAFNSIQPQSQEVYFFKTYSAGGYKDSIRFSLLYKGCDRVFPGHSASFIMHIELYRKYGFYNEEYKYMADYHLFLKLLSDKIRMTIIPDGFGLFTYGGYSSRNPYIAKRLEERKIFTNALKSSTLHKLTYLYFYNPLQLIYGFLK